MNIILVIALLIVSGLFIIFWMAVGWRAMRAHERLAEANQRITLASEHYVKHTILKE